jgi:hypothetical protein
MVIAIGRVSESATQGEKKFFSQVNSLFKDNNQIYCYIQAPVVDFFADFLVIGPKIGIIIVEVKDYLPETLISIGGTGKWTIVQKGNDETNELMVSNPFQQIYGYLAKISNRIGVNQNLNQLNVPVYQLVVFTNIERDSETGKKIESIKPMKINIIYKKELMSPNYFKYLFDNLSPSQNKPILTSEQFNLLRANIIPTSILPQKGQTEIFHWLSNKDRVKMLDLEQEKLAHELGEGHRLFYGVAGSGKTVLLIARARFLAKKYPNWKILVLCYNRVLRNALEQMIAPQNQQGNIIVENFHRWAKNTIVNYSDAYADIYNRLFSEANIGTDSEKTDSFFKVLVPNLLSQIADKGDHGNFDAILIDEGQDFTIDWFRAIMKYLNPSTNSILITLDGLQGIYEHKKIVWLDVGIDARGRVKKFTSSYRNPIEIGIAATHIIPENLNQLINSEEEFLRTEAFLGSNGVISLLIAHSRTEEYEKLTKILSNLVREQAEILILFKYNLEKQNYTHPLLKALEVCHLSWTDVNAMNGNGNGNKIHIGTLYSTKGLESDVVVIPELDSYREEREQQLLYVGFTRTVHKLILTACRETELIKKLTDNVKFSDIEVY